MKLSVGDDGTWVTWRTRAGHREGDTWVADDKPGERTGPFGKVHILALNGLETWCRHEIPDGAEFTGEANAAKVCHNCLRNLLRPYLP